MIHSMHPKLDQWQQDKNHVKLVLVKGKDLDSKYDTSCSKYLSFSLLLFILSKRTKSDKENTQLIVKEGKKSIEKEKQKLLSQ